MLNSNLHRSELLDRLHNARAETDALFDIIKPEFLFERPISERHRLAFYIGHLEAFDWNLLSERLHIAGSHADLDRLFAFGIDPVEGNLPSDQPSDWPTLEEIRAYRDLVREQIDAALNRADVDHEFEKLLAVVVEHRQMHAETLSYLFHQMPFDTKIGTRALTPSSTNEIAPETVRIPSGSTTLGLRAASGEFGWDNEFEAHSVDVPAFAIDKFKITNAQYLQFVEDNGYDNRAWWDDANWVWKTEHGIAHPAFWLRIGGTWFWRAMFDAVPLPLDGPVYVSHAEASAYARWAGRALPTEAQWQRAAYGASTTRVDVPTSRGFEPMPVNAGAANGFGLVGMHANGWEWTSTVFAPFAGFRTFDFYPGYSEPFFDGKHFVLKGGSVRTAPSMLRPSFRNWFQAHYQYVYAGFRCVDVDKESTIMTILTTPGIHLREQFAADVRDGLSRNGQKELPSKYLYDPLGSTLFDAITLLPEYGLTRADERLLQRHARDIAAHIPNKSIVSELGSGSGRKTRWILNALREHGPLSYYPIEISSAALATCEAELRDLDSVSIVGVESEYLSGLTEVAKRREAGTHLFVLFLGSTIGNFDAGADARFLREVRAILQAGDSLLLGTDLIKARSHLIDAYDDPRGVTAAFNLNLLGRINRELKADFDLRQFEHVARFNEATNSVEMHLRSKRAQNVRIEECKIDIAFFEAETIWTESSHKYTPESIDELARASGFAIQSQWIDKKWPFANTLLVAA